MGKKEKVDIKERAIRILEDLYLEGKITAKEWKKRKIELRKKGIT